MRVQTTQDYLACLVRGGGKAVSCTVDKHQAWVLPLSLQIKLKIPPPSLTDLGEQGVSVSADFASKQAVPGKSSKQQTWISGWGWVEIGPPCLGWAEACSLLGGPFRGSRVERKGQERAPWAISGFQGQGPDSKSFLKAMGTSPSCSEVSLAVSKQTPGQERT